MPLPTIATQALDFPASPDLPQLVRSLNTPGGLTLAGSLLLLGVLAVAGRGGKAKLATGRFASRWDRRAAQRRGIKQVRRRKANEVTLAIGFPGKAATLHLPDMQRGGVCIGSPGTGKTYSFIDPAVFSALIQGFPVILYDFKYPRQTARHAGLAKHLGYDVHVFAPGFAESGVCNPLDFMQDGRDALMARQIAKVLHRNVQLNAAQRSDDPFFSDAGEQLIEAVLTLTKASPYPDLMTAQALLSLPKLALRLECATTLDPWLRRGFDQLVAVRESEKTEASIVGTSASFFTRFMKPSLLAPFCGRTTLPLDLHGRQLLIFGMDKQRRDVIAPLAATMLHMIIIRNVRQARTEPLVVSIDELPTLYLPDLVQWINQHREDGLVMILGWQNMGQLEKAYGAPTSRAIFGACATKALFNPQEPESAKRFADYLGDEEILDKSKSRNRGGGKTSVGFSEHRRTRPLFAANQFRELPTGSCILISPGFGNARESAVPYRTRIKVPRGVTRSLRASANAWPRLQALLARTSTQRPPSEADLQQRIAYAEEILPLPAL